MSLRNKIICTYLCTIFCTYLNAQSLVQSFVDPCSKKVVVFVIPIQGSTVVFMGKAKYFTPSDVANGNFMSWINQVYLQYSAPCPVSVITNNMISNSISSAIAPPPTPIVQSSGSSSNSSPQGGGSSESKSESKSEGKSEDKKEDKKEEKKEEKKESKKSGSAMTPIIFSSDFSAVQQIGGNFTPSANLGLSQSSLTGELSYGATAIIGINMYAISARYSSMEFSNGKPFGSNSYSISTIYSSGSLIYMGGYSYVAMKAPYVYGYNISLIATKVQSNTLLMSSVVLFGMKSIRYSPKLSLTPELFIMNSPSSYITGTDGLVNNSRLGFIVGNSFDIALSKRFRISANLKYMLPPSNSVGLLVGSKFNL
jgi:hypothetical protein